MHAATEEAELWGDSARYDFKQYVGQLHRTTFCSLKHTCRSHCPAICLDSGLLIAVDVSLESTWGGGLGPCGGR